MSANTETTGGPPKGYFLCPDCKTTWAGVGLSCWSCRLKLNPRRQFSEADTFKAYPDWTPPIAAPAAHVERRKGQRWKSVHRFSNGDVLTVVGTLAVRSGNDAWSLSDVERSDGIGAFDSCFADSLWSNPSETMTLLADATPEPAKSCVCPHGPHATDGKCPIHVTAGMESSGFQGCACAKCVPPAQEAPKAATALEWSFTDDEGRKHFFATSNERDAASRAYGAWMKAQTGKPYAGPERLPRPQLAADWVEDCLPESGR